MGLEKLGAKIELESGYVTAKAKRLKGASIYLDIPTVTGTENLMMAAALAKGTTVLANVAREPEVVDLANALISMGAKIEGAGGSVIQIEGVEELRPLNYAVIPDRIEAGTFMTIAGITGGDIVIKGCRPEHLDAPIMKLRETGITFKNLSDGIRVIGPSRPRAADVKTMVYPGSPTDMQAQFMALLFPLAMFPKGLAWALWLNPITPTVLGMQSLLLAGSIPGAEVWIGLAIWILLLAPVLDRLVARSREQLVNWL